MKPSSILGESFKGFFEKGKDEGQLMNEIFKQGSLEVSLKTGLQPWGPLKLAF